MESESSIEGKVKRYAKAHRFYARKFSSPGNRSVPDDLFISPIGEVFFIEFKAKGKEPTEAQEDEIAQIRLRKGAVYVVDNVKYGKSIIDLYL